MTDDRQRRQLVLWSFVAPTAAAFLTGAVCFALYVMGRAVPPELGTVATMAAGYVFGTLPGFVKDMSR